MTTFDYFGRMHDLRRMRTTQSWVCEEDTAGGSQAAALWRLSGRYRDIEPSPLFLNPPCTMTSSCRLHRLPPCSLLIRTSTDPLFSNHLKASWAWQSHRLTVHIRLVLAGRPRSRCPRQLLIPFGRLTSSSALSGFVCVGPSVGLVPGSHSILHCLRSYTRCGLFPERIIGSGFR
jgi:hypothetical protein